MPSLTHCQNWAWVVQNSFRSRQITSAVFFFFFLSFFVLTGYSRFQNTLPPQTCSSVCETLKTCRDPEGKPLSEAAPDFQNTDEGLLNREYLQSGRWACPR